MPDFVADMSYVTAMLHIGAVRINTDCAPGFKWLMMIVVGGEETWFAA